MNIKSIFLFIIAILSAIFAFDIETNLDKMDYHEGNLTHFDITVYEIPSTRKSKNRQGYRFGICIDKKDCFSASCEYVNFMAIPLIKDRYVRIWTKERVFDDEPWIYKMTRIDGNEERTVVRYYPTFERLSKLFLFLISIFLFWSSYKYKNEK